MFPTTDNNIVIIIYVELPQSQGVESSFIFFFSGLTGVSSLATGFELLGSGLCYGLARKQSTVISIG